MRVNLKKNRDIKRIYGEFLEYWKSPESSLFRPNLYYVMIGSNYMRLERQMVGKA